MPCVCPFVPCVCPFVPCVCPFVPCVCPLAPVCPFERFLLRGLGDGPGSFAIGPEPAASAGPAGTCAGIDALAGDCAANGG